MMDRARGADRGRGDEPKERGFAPELAWAAAGGLVLLAAAAVLYTLAVAWGVPGVGVPAAGGPAAPLAAYASQLAGVFLAGSVLVLVARSLGARS